MKKLTVVIHDACPTIHLEQPCSLRTVVIELTEDQSEKLKLNHNLEGYSVCILEESSQ